MKNLKVEDKQETLNCFEINTEKEWDKIQDKTWKTSPEKHRLKCGRKPVVHLPKCKLIKISNSQAAIKTWFQILCLQEGMKLQRLTL